MLNQVDCSPDTPVIEAAAERMALKEMDNKPFRDTNEMSGFQTGYMKGFLEGAEFMRTFYRRRDMRDRLDRVERERVKRNRSAENTDTEREPVDDNRIKPVGDISPYLKR